MKIGIVRKVALLLLLPVVSALVSLGFFYTFLAQTAADSHFVDVASLQRLLAEQLGDYAHMVHMGQVQNRETLWAQIDHFDHSLSALEQGGPVMGHILPPPPAEIAAEIAAERRGWEELKPLIMQVASAPPDDAQGRAAYIEMQVKIPQLVESAGQVVNASMSRNRSLRERMTVTLALISGFDLVLLLAGIWIVKSYIAERRQAEERVQLVVEGAGDAFVAMDAAGLITAWNRQAVTTFGWSYKEAIGRTLAELIIPPRYREAHTQGLARFLATGEGPVLGQRIEIEALQRDGHEFPVELSITAIRDKRSYFFSAFLHDITRRRQAEEALKVDMALQRVRNEILQMQGEEDWQGIVVSFYRELKEVLSFKDCGINLLDRQRGTYLDNEINAAGELITKKYEPDSLPRALIQALDTDQPVYRRSRAEIDEFGDLIMAGTNCVLDVPFAGGTVAINSAEENAFSAQDIKVLERFAQVMSEAHQRLEDLKAHAQREGQLRQAQKLEGISQLAVGVAHEINNPLTSVLGYSELLLHRQELDPKMRQHLETIHQEGERARQIAERLLKFSRRQQADRQMMALNPLVAESLALMRQQFATDHVQLSEELAEDLPLVEVHPGQFQQVVMSLIQNSREAMAKAGKGGLITVRTSSQEGGVRLAVEDDGPGIPEALRARIFDPFFTTKEVGSGSGSGLGLSLCHSIALEHGGRLWAEARAAGACLVLELPVEAGAENATYEEVKSNAS